jgi:hypothetical protein
VQELLTTERTKPRKPEIESGKVTGACRGRDRVKKGPVDSGFHRDSIGSPKEPLRLKEVNFERSLRPGGQAQRPCGVCRSSR